MVPYLRARGSLSLRVPPNWQMRMISTGCPHMVRVIGNAAAAAATRQAGGEAKCVRLGGALNESRQIDPRSKERKLPRETTASRRCG